FLLAFLCVLFLPMPMAVWCQSKEYATVTPGSGRNSASILAGLFGNYTPTTNNAVAEVTAAAAAGDGDETTFATLAASNLNLLLIQNSGEAWVQPKFANTVNANQTTYVRISAIDAGGLSLDLLD